jgi:hypothetical protein
MSPHENGEAMFWILALAFLVLSGVSLATSFTPGGVLYTVLAACVCFAVLPRTSRRRPLG